MEKQKIHVPWYGYVALIATILILSGIFQLIDGPLSALDFSKMVGSFGQIAGTAGKATNFRGTGGIGARDSLLFVITLAPSVILAFAIIEVCINYHGLYAAERLLTPIMKPLLGLTGASGLAMVASFTSADVGAGSTRELYETGYLNDKQRLVFVAFQYSAPALIVNFYSLGTAALPYITIPASLIFIVIIVMKFIGAILLRFYLNFFMKESFPEENMGSVN